MATKNQLLPQQQFLKGKRLKETMKRLGRGIPPPWMIKQKQ